MDRLGTINIVGNGKLQMDLTKVSAVTEWPIPKNKKKTSRVSSDFYQQFIFNTIARSTYPILQIATPSMQVFFQETPPLPLIFAEIPPHQVWILISIYYFVQQLVTATDFLQQNILLAVESTAEDNLAHDLGCKAQEFIPGNYCHHGGIEIWNKLLALPLKGIWGQFLAQNVLPVLLNFCSATYAPANKNFFPVTCKVIFCVALQKILEETPLPLI